VKFLASLVVLLFISQGQVAARDPIRVGSKHFTESYILAEVMAQLLEANGVPVARTHGLGGTMICFEALRNGNIDVYPEYTGTIQKEILKQSVLGGSRQDQLRALRASVRGRFGLDLLASFGFNNSYAIAVTREKATGLALSTISDLVGHPELKGGLSYEFLEREDGWQELRQHYQLQNAALGLEHGLAYEALREGRIDFTDAYTTDAKIEKLKLALLDDDLNFFPKYFAVPFVAKGFPEEAKQILSLLSGRISQHRMSELNGRAELDQLSFSEVARAFLVEEKLISEKSETPAAGRLLTNLIRRTGEHLFLTVTALVLAILLAVPLGIGAHRVSWVAAWTMPLAGLLQTIPSIALLAFMIPVFGIGKLPAIVALFVYSLLPIVRNTYVGLHQIEHVYIEAADAMGMRVGQKMWYVELPLAYPVILAGIKTAAIINIGTATLAAFIGAGGLGEPIVTGLALNNHAMILEGAIPAAALAILTELTFRAFDPKKG